MSKQIVPSEKQELARLVAQRGQEANRAASRHVFTNYRQRKAQNTLRSQDHDLSAFAGFLQGSAGLPITAEALGTDPAAWSGLSWGLVAAFVESQLSGAYSVATVNRQLSTIKVYAKLASNAGALDKLEYLQIKDVSGYSRKERKRIDQQRSDEDQQTRRADAKKAEHVSLSPAQVKQLKAQPDTPQGRRDALLMCLMLDLGLRVGEVAGLTVDNVKLAAGELEFYRPKVDKTQTMDLRKHKDLWRAMKAWFDSGDAPAIGSLLRASRKGGALTSAGMVERTITRRVRSLGEQIGVEGLSAHDLRHSWATRAARQGTDPFALQEAGGWNSLAMPRRYVEAARIANEGVHLD